MPEFRELVDVETLLVPYLDADAGIAAPVTSPKLPKAFAAERRVRFFRVGGNSADGQTGYVDRALLQFDCYGVDPVDALDVARKTLLALQLAPAASFAGMVVSAVQRSSGPFWSPDPETEIPKYQLDVYLTVHPTAV